MSSDFESPVTKCLDIKTYLHMLLNPSKNTPNIKSSGDQNVPFDASISGTNFIRLRIFVLRTFSPYFRKNENEFL